MISRKKADLDGDGVITEEEAETANLLLKTDTQTRLAYIAIWSMVFFTLFLFLPVFPDTRIKALSDLITLFYLSNASIVGAYMGVTAYMSTKSSSLGKK
jgi:hypothetical protein